jgi:hypothetical protein
VSAPLGQGGWLPVPSRGAPCFCAQGFKTSIPFSVKSSIPFPILKDSEELSLDVFNYSLRLIDRAHLILNRAPHLSCLPCQSLNLDSVPGYSLKKSYETLLKSAEFSAAFAG